MSSSEDPPGAGDLEEILTSLNIARDAKIAVAFYNELLRLKVSPELAKDLTIAYLVRMTNVVQ